MRSVRKVKCILFGLAMSVITIVLNFGLQPSVLPRRLLWDSSCPVCLGTQLCSELHDSSNFELLWPIKPWDKLLNAHHVFIGKYKNLSVIIKELVQPSEADHVASLARKAIDIINMGTNSERTNHLPDLVQYLKYVGKSNEMVSAIRCLTPRTFNILIDGYSKTSKNHSDCMKYGISTLLLNPEPLLLSAFRKTLGYPFPGFIGVCNRMLLETNEGKPLREFMSSNFSTRVKISLALIDVVKKLTNNIHQVKLYITDPSLDNFVAALVGDKYLVSLVDLENILLVDPLLANQSRAYQWSAELNSESGFAFSIDDLCAYGESDHNEYAICQTVFNPDEGNFLHQSEHGNNSMRRQLESIIQNCINPSFNYSRASALQDLELQLQMSINY